MKPKLKDQLEGDLKEIVEILLTAQESLKIVDLILKPELDEDIGYEKRTNAFFTYSASMYWRITVIELSKLFSSRESDCYNLNRFLTKLEKNGYYGSALISEAQLTNWKNALISEKDAVSNLIQQRDKVYAHKDANHRKIPNTVSLTKTRELILMVQSLIKNIYENVFATSYLIDEPVNSPLEGLNSILNLLSEAKKKRRDQFKPIAEKYGLEKEC